ncbi:PH domain-containing protein [Kitasatospora herbaricolor]|uniref:PH domain-containing protein n=1 Tax=Kitasatospora herbaricolor TaxID=68217 RepID=A0ABZ1WDS6_9ACTN|nr:PH domain-containing protein [Kitasatospora herbaricolor]
MPAEPAPTLRPPSHRVDRRARRWWTAQALLTVSGPMLLTALALGVLALLFFPGALRWLGPLLLGALVAPALVYAVAMPRGRYAVQAWELGAHAVHTAHGWLWQRARIAPLSKVQTVDTVRGPVQRRYGLATVIVTTASTAGSIRIAGLADADAEELARRITEAARADGERRAGGPTGARADRPGAAVPARPGGAL